MSDDIVISVDAMGGDRAPEIVIAGLARALRLNPRLRFIIHGNEARIAPMVKRRKPLLDRSTLRHADDVIAMDAKPSTAVRRGRASSLWRTLESVRSGEASAAVSAGNTGALMAMAVFCLRTIKGVDRPAIAALWPSRSDAGFAVALDMGADIRADARDLVRYGVMGAEYARISLGVDRPRVGVLNVGIEETKGRSELHDAADRLRRASAAPGAAFDYIGFVEGNDIPGGTVDVIATDGFTGNIALKSAEGTARLIADFLREAFKHTWISRLGALIAYTSLRRFRKRIDPRRVNGGVFLGLNGIVIKSHGGADATGFAAAVLLAGKMAKAKFTDRISTEVARLVTEGPGGAHGSRTTEQKPA